jgi:hypothetical protein
MDQEAERIAFIAAEAEEKSTEGHGDSGGAGVREPAAEYRIAA